jgi:hypothetical protein
VVSGGYLQVYKTSTIEEWIRKPKKTWQNVSIMQKDVVLFFPLIGSWLVWEVRNSHRVRMGEDPWVGCGLNYRLPKNLIVSLRDKGLY